MSSDNKNNVVLIGMPGGWRFHPVGVWRIFMPNAIRCI